MGLPFLPFVDMVVLSYCAEEACSKASVINNYEDNSWAFVVITCLFA
jgi:hypothetical protein